MIRKRKKNKGKKRKLKGEKSWKEERREWNKQREGLYHLPGNEQQEINL